MGLEAGRPEPTPDTIVAIASPPGAGARGVLRVSGPRAGELVRAAVVAEGELPPPRRAALTGRFDDGRGTQPVLLLWMPGPASYTREDVAELHLPGSPPLLDAALERLLALGARLAEPGEFTRRAFLNGRLDLTRAEGVLELIEATNEGERRAAGELLEGGLADRVAELRERLVDLRTLCEASLDFDESDTGHVPLEELQRLGDAAAAALDEALAWEVRRQPPSTLPRVVLFGAPNAGKSSLFNALTEGEALVSDVAGTTRDWIGGTWPLAGGEVLLIDAPGWDAGALGPDAKALELAERERGTADLVVWVVDGMAASPGVLNELALRLPAGIPRVVAWNKVDLGALRAPPPSLLAILAGDATEPLEVVGTSAGGQGLDSLARAAAAALGRTGDEPEPESGEGRARELFVRHRDALLRARGALEAGRETLVRHAPLDLAAEAFREATSALDAITGRTSSDDVLDRIFARFCIGK